MFRTGPIRNFTPSEVTVVACVLAAEAPHPTQHEVTFSVVQLDRKPVTLHAERAKVIGGHMVTFEFSLAESVRSWEVRVDADPDLVFITIYHLIDGRSAPNMTYHTSDLYYVDLLDEIDDDSDASDDIFGDDGPFGGKFGMPPNWIPLDDSDDRRPWG